MIIGSLVCARVKVLYNKPYHVDWPSAEVLAFVQGMVINVFYYFSKMLFLLIYRDAVDALLKYEASTNIPDYAGVCFMAFY